MKKILLIPDCHVPAHDAKAWKLLLKVARSVQFDKCVILGDFLDCESVSRHPKDSATAVALHDEIVAGTDALDELDAALGDKVEKYFLFGNHEYRLERYIAERPELVGSLDLREQLDLAERGWKAYKYRAIVKLGKLFLTHDCGNAGKYAHSQAVDKVGGNIVHGHTHRIGYIVRGNLRDNAHVGMSIGWLGDKTKISYRDQASVTAEWALGFGVGIMEPNGTIHLQPVPIIGYKCCVFGEIYR